MPFSEQSGKNYSGISSNILQLPHIIFEIPNLGGYFLKIKMRIYSEDLPGRNSRIKWLFNVIMTGRGNLGKKSLKSQSF